MHTHALSSKIHNKKGGNNLVSMDGWVEEHNGMLFSHKKKEVLAHTPARRDRGNTVLVE